MLVFLTVIICSLWHFYTRTDDCSDEPDEEDEEILTFVDFFDSSVCSNFPFFANFDEFLFLLKKSVVMTSQDFIQRNQNLL